MTALADAPRHVIRAGVSYVCDDDDHDSDSDINLNDFEMDMSESGR